MNVWRSTRFATARNSSSPAQRYARVIVTSVQSTPSFASLTFNGNPSKRVISYSAGIFHRKTVVQRNLRRQPIKQPSNTTALEPVQFRMSSDKTTNNADFELTSLFNVKDKVALVTGGGSGIGLMAVQALAVNGAKVYITGRTSDKLDTVVATHGSDIAGQIIPLTADITSKADIARLYDTISQKEKHLDILINNAGISTKTLQTEASSAEEMKKNLFDNEDAQFEDWDAVYRTNVSHCYFTSTAFLPLLAKATENKYGNSGVIINITSISGQVKTMQHHPQYNASKAAQIHLSRMLANEIANNGIKVRVNNIAPGKSTISPCR